MGPASAVTLLDGRVLAASSVAAEIYDPALDRWTVIPDLQVPEAATVTMVPNGNVAVVGGIRRFGVEENAFTPLNRIATFDPRTGRVSVSFLPSDRYHHATAVTDDGAVLLLGGESAFRQITSTVEEITWEPQVSVAGVRSYQVATSTAPMDSGGFWGLEITAPGRLHGGLNFGGTVPARGADVGFAGFNLPEAQTVTGRIDFQPLGGGNFEAIVRLLDVNKQPVAPEIRGGTHIEFSQQLQPGFCVVEVQTGPNSPTASYQFALSAPVLSGGAVAGGVLDPATGVPGFAGFYLAEAQDVTVRLLNEQTYGSPRGAGEVILTLYDAAGRVIARQGPGAMQAH